jgi:hypothetical protein
VGLAVALAVGGRRVLGGYHLDVAGGIAETSNDAAAIATIAGLAGAESTSER